MKLIILNWGRAYLLFKYFYNSNKPTLRYSMRTYTLCSLNGANSLVVKDIFLPNYLSNVLIYDFSVVDLTLILDLLRHVKEKHDKLFILWDSAKPCRSVKAGCRFFRNRLFFCQSVCEKFCMPSALLYTRVILFRLMLIVLFTLRQCFQPLN